MKLDNITSARYVKAIDAVDSEIGHKLLQAHLAFQYRGILPTREQLAKKVGLNGGCAANLHYGKFAHAVGERLGVHQAPLLRGWPYWMLVLEYEPEERGAKGHTAYQLRPQVMKALAIDYFKP